MISTLSRCWKEIIRSISACSLRFSLEMFRAEWVTESALKGWFPLDEFVAANRCFSNISMRSGDIRYNYHHCACLQTKKIRSLLRILLMEIRFNVMQLNLVFRASFLIYMSRKSAGDEVGCFEYNLSDQSIMYKINISSAWRWYRVGVIYKWRRTLWRNCIMCWYIWLSTKWWRMIC